MRKHGGDNDEAPPNVWRLIRMVYAATLPWFVAFVLGLTLVTWLVVTALRAA
jgi:hypothetical protein